MSAHVETAHDFHVAVEAGIDEINHLPAYVHINNSMNYLISQEDAKRAQEKGIVVIPTYSLLHNDYNKGTDSLTRAKIKAIQIEK